MRLNGLLTNASGANGCTMTVFWRTAHGAVDVTSSAGYVTTGPRRGCAGPGRQEMRLLQETAKTRQLTAWRPVNPHCVNATFRQP